MPTNTKAVAALFVSLEGAFAKFDNAMQQASSKFKKFANTMFIIGEEVSKGLTEPFEKWADAAVEAAVKVEDAINDIRVATGANADQMAGLKETFTSVYKEVANSAGDAAKVIGTLNQQLGLSGKPLEELSKQILDISQLTKTDAGENAKFAAQAFNEWGIATDKQKDALDFLFAAGEKTIGGFTALSQGVVQLGPQFKALGFTFEQSAAAVSQFSKFGQDAAPALQGLLKAASTLQSKGIKDVPTALNKMLTVIKNMKDPLAAAGIAMEVFGKKAGAKIADAVRNNTFSVNDFVKAVKGSGETVQKAIDDTSNFERSMTELKHSVELAAEPLGKALKGALDNVAPIIQKAADALKELSEGFANLAPSTQANIVTFAIFIGSIGPVALAISGISAACAALIGAFGTLFKVLGAGRLPWLAIIAAIEVCSELMETPEFATGIAIIEKAFSDWFDELKTGTGVIEDFLSTLKTDFMGGLKVISDSVTTAKENIVQSAEDIYQGLKTNLVDKFTDITDGIKKGVDTVYNFFADLKSRLLDHSPIPDIAEGQAKYAKQGSDAMIAGAKTGTEGAGALFALFAKNVKTKLTDAQKDAQEAAKILAHSFNSIEDAVHNAGAPLDDLQMKIKTMIEAQDVDGLNKLAEQYSKTADGARSFSQDLKLGAQDARQEIEQLKTSQKDLNTAIEDAGVAAGTFTEKFSPAVQQMADLLKSGDIEGLKKLTQDVFNDPANYATAAEKLKQITDQLQQSKKLLEDNKQRATEFATSAGGAFTQLALALGAANDTASSLGDGVTKAINLLKQMQTEKAAGKTGVGDSFGGLFDSISNAINGKDNNTDGSFDFGSVDWQNIATSFQSVLGTVNGLVKDFKLIGKSTADTIQGISGGAGAAIGGAFGGPEGAAIGQQIGDAVGKVVGGLFKKTMDADTKARNTVLDNLNATIAKTGLQITNSKGQSQNITSLTSLDGSAFKGDWAAQFASFGKEAMQTFGGLGDALTKLLGVTQDVGQQIGFILAKNLNGNVDNARVLVDQLGLKFSDLEDVLLTAAKKGDISWSQFESDMQGLANAFTPGIQGVGNFVGAMDELAASGARGEQAIKGVKDIGVEATEAGIKTLADLRAHLIASGKYSVDQIDTLFNSLKARNVQTVQDLSNVSDRVAGGIVADMQAAGFQFAQTADDASSIADSINSIPDDSTKNVEVNITTNLDQNTQDAMDAGLIPSTKSQSSGSRVATSKELKSGDEPQTTLSTGEQVNTSDFTGINQTSSSGSSSGSHSSSSKPRAPAKPKLTDLQTTQIDQRKQAFDAVKDALAIALPGFNQTTDNFSQSAFDKSLASLTASFKKLSANSQEMFKGIANGLSKTLGLSQDVANQLAVALGSKVKGDIDSIRHAVASLNITLSDSTDAIADLVKTGKISISDAYKQITQLTNAFQPGISGIGNVSKAFDTLTSKASSNFDKLQSIRDLAVEAMEKGGTSVQDLQNQLLAAGKPAAQVADLIAGINKYLDQFHAATATVPQDVQKIADALRTGDNATLAQLEKTALAGGTDVSARFYDAFQQAQQLVADTQSELAGLAGIGDTLATEIVGSAGAAGLNLAAGVKATGTKVTAATTVATKKPTTSTTGASKTATTKQEVTINNNLNVKANGIMSTKALTKSLKDVHTSAVATSVKTVAKLAKQGGSYSQNLKG